MKPTDKPPIISYLADALETADNFLSAYRLMSDQYPAKVRWLAMRERIQRCLAMLAVKGIS